MNDRTETPLDDKAAQRRGRILAASVVLVVLLPMLSAYVVYFTGVGVPEGTINKGVLLTPPVPISDWQLRTLDGEPWVLKEQPIKWRLLIPGGATCDQACKENLYLTRQVHIRLGEKGLRVERLYLLTEPSLSDSLSEHLEQEHARIKVVQLDEKAMVASLANTNLSGDPIAEGRYFLMDQEGFVMMGYDLEQSGNDLLKDIKRMLRYSYEE